MPQIALMGNISETHNDTYHYHLSKGVGMTPETKAVLQTLLKYRDSHIKDYCTKFSECMHPENIQRFIGQGQGVKILTDQMLLHYKTTEGEVNAE